MKKKSILFCFLLCFVFGLSFAQSTRVSLRPYLGLQQKFSHIIDNSRGSSTFDNHVWNESLDLGLLLETEINGKYKIITGIAGGLAGTSYGLTITKPKNPYGSPRKRRASASPVTRIPILFSLLSRQINWIPIRYNRKRQELTLGETDRENRRYLFNFRVEPFVGMAYNRLNLLESGELSGGTVFIYGDSILIESEKTTEITANSISVILGATLQFMHQGKQRLAFTFYYNRGLNTLLRENIVYTLNGTTYQTVQGARGTTIGLDVSYPIRLYDSVRRKRLYKER